MSTTHTQRVHDHESQYHVMVCTLLLFRLLFLIYYLIFFFLVFFFFFQAEDGIRDLIVTGVQTCALPICSSRSPLPSSSRRSSAWAPAGCATCSTRRRRSRPRSSSSTSSTPLDEPAAARSDRKSVV